MSDDFIRDTTRNRIADRLREAFFAYYRYNPSPGEVNSWRNSLRAMKDVLDIASLHDHGILLEYQLPLSSRRIDCMVCGHDENNTHNAVIVELKQWERCDPAEPDRLVRSWVGGRQRDVLHPSVQVGQYREYLEDTHIAFHEEPSPIRLSACSYLHNYFLDDTDPILAPKFAEALRDNPLFDADGAESLGSYLSDRLAQGNGRPVLQRVEDSRFRPSRKLMDYVSTTIRSHSPWILLDEQLVVFERIRATLKSGLFGRRKQVVIVRGGPGTGKSVLAINLMAELLRERRNAHYATGSKAFTETLWEIMGSRSRATFKYFNSYGPAEFNEVDVLICDESHRIRETSNSRFAKRERRSTKPQVREILDAAKVAVFFIDDRQIVRPNEIGSTMYIRQHADAVDAEVSEYDLEVQFRCAGSDGFVNWIDNTLGIRRTANVIWDGADGFDFRIVASPEELETSIRLRSDEGFTARVAAGFCWRWSEPRPDGTLVDDVVIGDYRRPWDAKPGNWRLAPGIPPASLWATDPNGINQIGCVYNIQGFELDYIGVIWGRDLRYNLDGQSWVGDKKQSADTVVKRSKEQFVDLVKNTYRVLLSRGIKGCYVHFMDRDTERFVRSRIESSERPKVLDTEPTASPVLKPTPFRPLTMQPTPAERYTTCVPLLPLSVAAGAFSDPQHVDENSWEWVAVSARQRLRRGMFVAKVTGRSMEPLIPDGSWCLFSSPVHGTRHGKIVLVMLRDQMDPESNQRFTVKRYDSVKTAEGEQWRHTSITLKALNPDFPPIPLVGLDEDQVPVIAELVEVLGSGS
jgi:SOS-response transcriptional repressor LexA